MAQRTLLSFCVLALLLQGCTRPAPRRRSPPPDGGAQPARNATPDAGRGREVREHGQERPEEEQGGLMWTRNP